MLNIAHNPLIIRALTVLSSLEFCASIWVVYLATRHDISMELFLLIEGMFAFAVVLLEIPTSFISDWWRRKSVMIVGQLLAVCAWVLLLSGEGLWVVIFAQIMLGFGRSFLSGTTEALLYESLDAMQQVDHYDHWYAKQTFYAAIGAAIATLTGGFMYVGGVDWPIIAVLLTSLIGLALCLLLTEPDCNTNERASVTQFEVITSGIYNCLCQSDAFRNYMCINAIVFGSVNVLYWLNQAYFESLSISPAWFSVLLFLDSVLGGLGARLLPLVKNFPASRVLWGVVLSVAGLAALIACLPLSYFGVAALLGFGFLWGFGHAVLHQRLQELAPPSARATALSIGSMLYWLWFSVFSAIASIMFVMVGVAGVFGFASLCMLFGSLPFLMGWFDYRVHISRVSGRHASGQASHQLVQVLVRS